MLHVKDTIIIHNHKTVNANTTNTACTLEACVAIIISEVARSAHARSIVRAREIIARNDFWRLWGRGYYIDGSVQVSFIGHPCRFQSGGEPRWHAP